MSAPIHRRSFLRQSALAGAAATGIHSTLRAAEPPQAPEYPPLTDLGVRDFNLRFADFPRTEGALRFAREIAPRLKP